MQQRAPIEEQIDLPFVESLRISFQSLKIRFGRSIITTAGITLGIAFLVSVWTNNEIGLALQESGRQSTINTFEDTTEAGISTKDIWLIIMSLIVCVVGIANSMLMAVTERFREIGTMKCLGALDGFVVRLFLLESGFQGFSGALIGALIGTLGAVLLGLKDYGLDLFFYFPLLPAQPEDGTMQLGVIVIILLGCILGMILAVIGSSFPAWRAAKLPPAEAMRTEV
ncbi:MAG: FtsX-like permease family protein [Candidatus Poribacteria bacterium]|nr:FtsX-like permease family protein [Candidatus Poribacteria bacterium]